MIANWHQLAEETDPKQASSNADADSDAALLQPRAPASRVEAADHGAERQGASRLASAGRRSTSTGDERKGPKRRPFGFRGLGRIPSRSRILRCLDFSGDALVCTRASIKGKERGDAVRKWIVSGLRACGCDRIGACMKIPADLTGDDNSGKAVPKYRNLWEHVKSKLPKKGDDSDESHPLTDYLSEVDGPLKQLAGEWDETFDRWRAAGRTVPPVMIVHL